MTMTHKVLVLGIDGVRYDALQQVRTPHLDAIAAAGFIRPIRVDDAAPTISGPGWATVATGVLAPKHQIYGNDLAGNALHTYPDFLTRLSQLGFGTYAAAAWQPLLSSDSGGPVFLGGGFQPAMDSHDGPSWRRADRQIAEHAAKALGSGDVSAAFVYLGAPDEVAHQSGTGPEYLETVEGADIMVGTVLDALKGDWVVIAVTDHGHIDGGGHGGDSEFERTAWVAACGPTIPTTAPESLGHKDIHPHLLTSLGVDFDPAWGLDGKPFDS
jgi:hypothetical protein